MKHVSNVCLSPIYTIDHEDRWPLLKLRRGTDVLDRERHQDVGQQQHGHLHFLSGDHMKQWVRHTTNHYCEKMLMQGSLNFSCWDAVAVRWLNVSFDYRLAPSTLLACSSMQWKWLVITWQAAWTVQGVVFVNCRYRVN